MKSNCDFCFEGVMKDSCFKASYSRPAIVAFAHLCDAVQWAAVYCVSCPQNLRAEGNRTTIEVVNVLGALS